MWFEELVGFEESIEGVRRHLTLHGSTLVSAANGRRLEAGRLTLPELRTLQRTHVARPGRPQLREEVGDARALHADPAHAGALFQVASQFNLLEMASPQYTPEDGVAIYAHDRTQGPACAMAAGAGTIYRNWFAPVGDQIGQTADRQLDAFGAVGQLLGNNGTLWTLRNGYALFDADNDDALTRRLDEVGASTVRGALQVGCHDDVQVTVPGANHLVTQVYGSALPLAYMRDPQPGVRRLAELVLEASYEATLLLASANAARTGNERVFLTLLGGGVFGNPRPAILGAIHRALQVDGLGPLDVRIVSHARSAPDVRALAGAWT